MRKSKRAERGKGTLIAPHTPGNRSSSWYWQYSTNNPVTQKRKQVRVNLEVETKTAAIAKRDELIFRMRENSGLNGNPDKVTIDELAHDLLIDYDLHDRSSLERTRISIKHILGLHAVPVLKKALPNLKESQLQPIVHEVNFGGMLAKDVQGTTSEYKRVRKQELEATKGKGCSLASINRELAALKRCFTLGIKNRKIRESINFTRFEEDNEVAKHLKWEDFLKVVFFLPEYVRPATLFAYFAGWRKSKVLGLKWEQVDWNEGMIYPPSGQSKTKQVGEIDFSEFDLLREVLENQRQKQKKSSVISPLVFDECWKNGKMRDFRGAWASAFRKAGIEKVRFHDLRASAAINADLAGISLVHIMTRQGWNSNVTLKRYLKTTRQAQKVASQKLSSLYGDSSKEINNLFGKSRELNSEGENRS